MGTYAAQQFSDQNHQVIQGIADGDLCRLSSFQRFDAPLLTDTDEIFVKACGSALKRSAPRVPTYATQMLPLYGLTL